jgi:hypothetical protein
MAERKWPNATGATSTPDPAGSPSRRAALSRPATALRTLHGTVALAELGCLVHLWRCAVTRRRDRLLTVATGALLGEGVALVVGHGDCPLGPLQQRLGDPIPLFELVLPPRAAKAAVPVLTAVAVTGLAVLVLRPASGRNHCQRTLSSAYIPAA